MSRPRTTRRALYAAVSLTCTGLLVTGLAMTFTGPPSAPEPGTPHRTSTVTAPTVAPSRDVRPWPGQLNGPVKVPAQTARAAAASSVTVDAATLRTYSRGQVEQAWTVLRGLLIDASTSPRLVDPSRPIAAADLGSVAALTFSPQARSGLGHLVPQALGGDDGAVDALLPVFFWQGLNESAAAPLRLGKTPLSAFTITSVDVQEVSAGGRTALGFQVGTELELAMVDPAGTANRLTLVRQVSVAMTPRAPGEPEHAPAWQVDGWTGSWQQLKPPGQKLPEAAQDAAQFQPPQATATPETSQTSRP